MADDGGSTGALRRELGVPAPGDIRRHMLALSDAPEWKRDLWNMRFGAEDFGGGHRGHNFGNLFLAGLSRNLKDYDEVLEECRKFLDIDKRYRPMPAATGDVVLCAELENGEIIEGESEIDVPKIHDAEMPIRKVFLKRQVRAYAPALLAVAEADALIFGPGDLFSSTLPCLLPGGMKKALGESHGVKILIVNIMNKRGETAGFTVERFAREVEKYLGTELDYVLYNNELPTLEMTVLAQREYPDILEPVTFGDDLDKEKFIGASLLREGALEHDTVKIGKMLWKLIAK
jgi:uncharacterized cofD-like protein